MEKNNTLSFSQYEFFDTVYPHFLTAVSSGLKIFRFEKNDSYFFMNVADLADVFSFFYNARLNPEFYNYVVTFSYDETHQYKEHFQVSFND